MSDDDVSAVSRERVPSGVPGLDAILRGGFFRGGVYMLLAPPGTGKTILANQICFRQVAAGGRALYVTLLTESHSRLLSSMQTLGFFDASVVGASLSYVTGYPVLEEEKLKGLLALLRQMIRDQKASFLVIDGFVMLGALSESEVETKKFVHELQVFAELVGCTVLVLTGVSKPDEPYALRTMVDGLLEMHVDTWGMEAARTIEVSKFRGGGMLMGRHLFEISDAGVTIYPRTESLRGKTLTRTDSPIAPPASFGIKGLDTMLGGGLHSGSITMVLGAPGSGKTLLGLTLLGAGATNGEPGLYFGFFESAADLCRRAEGIGIGLSKHLQSGLVEIMWQSPLDAIADSLADKVLAAVRDRGVRRLFIDGLGGFKDSLVYADRSRRFFGALCSELHSLGVVTVLSDQTCHLSDIEFPEHGLTAMLDTVIGLRHVERDSRVCKLVSLLKMREAGGDPSSREFSIGARGFVVSSSALAESTLSALPRGDGVGPKASRGSTKKGSKKRPR